MTQTLDRRDSRDLFIIARTPRDLTRSLTEGGTRPGSIVGTIAYLSPEQATGRPLDARSDIFSFGIVLYELLAGRRPFDGLNDLETLQKIIHGSPQLLDPHIPEPLSAIVEKALENDPANRYQTARDLVVDLRRASRSQTRSTPAAASSTSRRAAYWIAAAAATALIVAAAVLFRDRGTRPQNPLVGAKFTRLTVLLSLGRQRATPVDDSR